jgi:excisionase family DNA binding protein
MRDHDTGPESPLPLRSMEHDTVAQAMAEAVRKVVREEVAPLRRQLEELRDQKRPPETAVNVKEAARRMSVSPRTIQRMLRSGELQSIPVGRARRVLVASLIQER